MPLSNNNDMTGQYLRERQSVQLTPYDQLMMEDNPQPEENLGADPVRLSPGAIAKDIGRGITETPKQIIGGIAEAFKEAGDAASSIVEWFGLPSVVQFRDEKGNFDLELLTRKEFEEKGGQTPVQAVAEAEGMQPQSATGGLVRGISQFLTGFIPANRALKAVGPVTKGAQVVKTALAGMTADSIVFDPHEKRLANLIQDHTELEIPVVDFLASDPNDTEALGRFKNAVEGLGLGVLTDGFVHAVRGVRASRVKRLESKARAKEAEQIDKLADIDQIDAPEEGFVQFDQKQSKSPRFKIGSKKAGEERALNINTDKIQSTDDVKSLIDDVGKVFSKDINKARREEITWDENIKLADSLGMKVEDLINRETGEAFNAEQALAARKILVASGENLVSLAKKAKTGSEEELIKFRRAMSQHHAIQSQVAGLTAEAGRALQSFRIQAKSGKEQARLISEALEAGGGAKNSKALAAQVSELGEAHQLNVFVKQAAGATTKEMMYEAWINGLLSSPATHAVNILSNSIVAGWRVGERKVASMIGRTLDHQSIPEGEATAQLFGMIEGAKDGMSLAWHALKTGEPSDILTKMENQGYRAISSENLGLAGVPGQFADFIGSAVRMPSRFLTAGDELFKSIGYRMELNAQAFRQANEEGLTGAEMATRIKQIIDDPPENIQLEAIDSSRYQTFTNPLGESGQALQRFVQVTPGAKLIVPFIRTPVNIMKFVGERTPAAPFMKSVREEIMSGGARRDMAFAKIATGSMVMAAAADMTMSGQVTGGGPVNPEMRNILRATGWQPYSIKVGDEYFSYGRLDPIGATIGIAADVAEIIGQLEDAEASEIALASAVAAAQNVSSKTYLRGVSEFFNVMSSVSPDPDKRLTRFKRWAERYAGTVVPSGVAQIERALSPELEATEGYIQKIRSRIPGFSDSLPPRRNIFGEPIVLSGGLGPDIMSPIYTSTDKNDPVADEIVKQKTLVRMPLKTIDGVRLTTEQYDQYIRFYSGENNEFIDKPLKMQLLELFDRIEYTNGTDGQEGSKSMAIRAVFEAYRESAKAMMLKTDQKLFNEVMTLKREKIHKLGG